MNLINSAKLATKAADPHQCGGEEFQICRTGLTTRQD